ncbi:MAG: hypothetical protein GX113_03030 [Actinobacteria bacterium]|jgi:polyferredoxin|nr:hypothetical protein [Actinomycetota bacterium]
MACFVAPAATAIVTTVVQRVVEKREGGRTPEQTQKVRGTWSQRLRWLNTMLWGGTALLALEHVWHGELVPWPPFLTAMQTPGETGPMLHEILTYGVTMTAVVIAAWGIMVGVAELRARTKTLPEVEAEIIDGGS